jgi:glycosyltransferase involved in cell wall biosynthesis
LRTPFRVLVFWEPSGLTVERANPYAPLLAEALSPLGVECDAGYPENLTAEWVAKHAGQYRILHLHWPSGLYASEGLDNSVKRCAEMLDALFLARSMGCKIVWTMHNLYPHDSGTHELDHLMRLAITSVASAVIVHCERGRDALRRVFQRDEGVFTIPHGHFMAPYANDIGRAEARGRFGFDERHFVYLFFGNVRANKGVEQLLHSFGALPGQDLRLLFAARVCSAYGAAVVEGCQQTDPRIVLYESEMYGNDELQLFYNAADVAVFPFTDILTSGSAITALSFYCPVVVPAIGCLPELVDESVGLIYDPQTPDALAQALQKAEGIRRDDLRPGIERKLAELNWRDIALKTMEAYRH